MTSTACPRRSDNLIVSPSRVANEKSGAAKPTCGEGGRWLRTAITSIGTRLRVIQPRPTIKSKAIKPCQLVLRFQFIILFLNYGTIDTGVPISTQLYRISASSILKMMQP